MTATSGEIATWIGLSIVICTGIALLVSRLLAFIERKKKKEKRKE